MCGSVQGDVSTGLLHNAYLRSLEYERKLSDLRMQMATTRQRLESITTEMQASLNRISGLEHEIRSKEILYNITQLVWSQLLYLANYRL